MDMLTQYIYFLIHMYCIENEFYAAARDVRVKETKLFCISIASHIA